MKSALALLITLFAASNAIELTSYNWDEATAGKSIFVKMFAPWCGHCKKMKPDWDKLMDDFKDSEIALVAEVDCTTEEGKGICIDNGVRMFPTLKYGDPSALKDYKGGREYDSLKSFADENLKPMCSPTNIDLCDAEQKEEIEKFQAMSPGDLEAAIAEKTKMKDEAEEAFQTGATELKSKYQKMMEDRDKTIEEIENSGLSMMKAVKAAVAKKVSSEI